MKITRAVAYDRLRRPTLTEYKDDSELLLTSYSETWGNGKSLRYKSASELTDPGFDGFTHDDHGNLTCKDRSSGTGQNFAFDTLNRLVVYDPGSQGGGDRWLYYCDALGRRVLKQSEDGSQKNYFFYDGNSVVLEVVEENGTSQTRQYINGPGTDHVVTEIFSGTQQYRPLDGS